ncbi:3-dehydroquinate synthase [Sphingobacterium arenae]|uniref:3-dehydroquinate synthase n=1 Tax=Sphingobacterium arenae TaxID=1280598 RepID=A0ABR7Y1Y3_9SPHI|nr:3-dehydroquinate synthase [Sphingobacterium arenae]MBD1425310.1 3-dehydroquinate synthase [Sphingobacterium arenae]
MTKQIASLGYSVFFENNLESLATFITSRSYSQILVLVDRNTNDHCLPILQSALSEITDYDIIEIDPGEENKNIDFCIGVWKTMLDFGADRKALMINLGGGVVTDMGGFAASTFKRGIDFIQIPTTLLSQVDASVGGKTGIDLDHIKNIVGTFTQPQAVFISGKFLETLDDRQMRSGFAEVIKHGLIYDKDLFFSVKDIELSSNNLDSIIFRSVEIKNEVITQDPTENGLRKILNFGHTIGHAVEAYSLIHDANPLLHGEAIALGMICEAYIAHKINGLSGEDLAQIETAFDNRFEPYSFTEEIYSELIALMQNDKKNDGKRLGFALLSEIGKCDYDRYVKEELIIESLNFYKNKNV